MGVKELIFAADLLDLNLDIVVMGIQVEELSWGLGLSETVKNAVPFFKEAVINQINRYLDTNGAAI